MDYMIKVQRQIVYINNEIEDLVEEKKLETDLMKIKNISGKIIKLEQNVEALRDYLESRD